ncbi:ROK family protein [Candidatus Dojkabacteria bacterium]|uniref:ROK family protein n=1 Tax=Candidatus Dojkabacteria bacterium TaxID=2099670 RepID=A0A955I7L0_9BACT|nr:ROK family protein [Candidatus Dojkabacteria bacterium]
MYLVCDIGGTKTRLGISESTVELGHHLVIDTPVSYEETLEAIAQFASQNLASQELGAVVVGVAGPLDPQREQLVRAPHLQAWEGKPLKADLQKRLNCQKVSLVNDTALVGLGEAVRGAGKNGKVVAYVTFSTGVGGVRITNGKIDDTQYGFEPGHQLISHDGRLAAWEDLVSGSGIAQRYGKSPSEIVDQQIWEEVTRIAALGLHNLIVSWSPDTVVLGGGLIISQKLKTDVLAAQQAEMLRIFPAPPLFATATLGDLGGLQGGLAFLADMLSSAADYS